MEAIVLLMGITLFVVLAFVYKSRSDKKKKRNLIESKISESALRHNLKWSHIDIGDHRGIAWSDEARKLISVNLAAGGKVIQFVDMDGIGHCELIEQGHSGKTDKAIYTTSVTLQLVPRDKQEPAVLIPFYKEEIDGVYEKMMLMQKARHWKSILWK